ncbi:MAG: SRPBCC family protein [Myxococcota bacterium]
MDSRSERPSLGALLFGLDAPVGRRSYALTGFSLMAIKYALDAALIYAFTKAVWTPLQYLSPALFTRTEILEGEQAWLLARLMVLALPFLWVGLSMSVRRARDAGYGGTLGLLFLFPGLNYLMMLALAAAPSRPRPAPTTPPHLTPEDRRPQLRAALLGTGVGTLIALAMVGFSVSVLGDYGQTLFAVTPAVLGATSSWFFNRQERQSVRSTLGVACLAVLVAGGAILLFALEGIVCLAMAAPLAMVMACLGALVARVLASEPLRRPGQPVHFGVVLLLALPLAAALEKAPRGDPMDRPETAPVREVRTSVIVEAPPSAVWPNVIGFAELPPPDSLLFRAGIAYPMRARIEGSGVGAVRHCEFSTGAFVEPITRWEPPRRLSFDVVAQPPPMTELSPYEDLHPPHLGSTIRSRRGEFRLVDLGDGRTRLEGSTWYALDIHPRLYWAFLSDALLHGIHRRVLEHVKALSEASPAT